MKFLKNTTESLIFDKKNSNNVLPVISNGFIDI